MKEKDTNEVKKNFDGKFPNFNVEEDLPEMANDIAEKVKELISYMKDVILKDRTLSEEDKENYIQILDKEFEKYL